MIRKRLHTQILPCLMITCSFCVCFWCGIWLRFTTVTADKDLRWPTLLWKWSDIWWNNYIIKKGVYLYCVSVYMRGGNSRSISCLVVTRLCSRDVLQPEQLATVIKQLKNVTYVTNQNNQTLEHSSHLPEQV